MSVEDFFDEFCRRYRFGELDAMAGMFRCPVCLERVMPIKNWDKLEKVSAFLRARWELTRYVGCHDYDLAVTEHRTDDDGFHDVDVVWDVFDAHGRRFWQHPATYRLTACDDGALRIVAVLKDDTERSEAEVMRRLAMIVSEGETAAREAFRAESRRLC